VDGGQDAEGFRARRDVLAEDHPGLHERRVEGKVQHVVERPTAEDAKGETGVGLHRRPGSAPRARHVRAV